LHDRSWITVQKKTFTRWANNYLLDRKVKINDLATDLGDGLMLIDLLEILSTKEVGKYNKKPRNKPQKLENLNMALIFISHQGIKLVGIGAPDIHDGNLKLILGLIWTLILRFQIERGSVSGSAKQELLEWVRKQVAPYGLKPKNFTTDWTDGKLLSALTDSLKPGVINMAELSKDPLVDTNNAMDVAATEYEIPKLIDATDMVECPDELSTMTYVSYFRDWWQNDQLKRAAEIEAERLRKLKTADPTQCYAFGPGLEKGYTFNDCPFTIQSVNYFGDKLPVGGTVFVVLVSGPDCPECQVVDNNDGTYSCTYVPKEIGRFNVGITCRETAIKDSPFHPDILGSDASVCVASGPGIEGARVNQPAPFKIQSFSRDGLPVPVGNDPYTVSVTGPNGELPVELVDNKDGTYAGSYTPNVPGVYTVGVLLNGQHIRSSPFHPLMEAGHSELCWAEGKGLEGGKTGNDNPITIHSVDSDGMPVNFGGDPFVVEVHGPVEQRPEVHDNQDGTYSVNYDVTVPGDYTIEIKLHDRPIKDSPFQVHFIPDARQTTASGPGVEGSRINQDAPFVIQSKAADGSLVRTGGDKFKASVTGPAGPLPVSINDNRDGTYDCSYHPAKPGFYTVEVLLNDEHICGSPFNPLMEAGNAGNSWAEGPGLQGGKTKRSNPFTIHSVDGDGNPVQHGGDPFIVEVKSVEGHQPTELNVVDNNDGTYSVDYKVEEPGTYDVSVSLHGQPIKDAPFSVVIKPDVEPSLCFAEGPGLNNCVDNEPTHFTIHAVDGDNQHKNEGGDPFEVRFEGPEAITPEVIDNNDGTYTVKYNPNVPGDYTVFVTLENQNIKDAPFSLSCKAGTDHSNTKIGPISFTVQTRDKRGDNKTFGGDQFEVNLEDHPEITVETRDNSDGTYTASFVVPPAEPTTYKVHVSFNGAPLSQSPLTLSL
jgi:filamin